MSSPRIIISGGGTGGHIFPALSIADSIRALRPDAEILFVGAEGRMEMERVPAAGYPIKGLPVAGLRRKLSFANLALPFKLLRSIRMAGRIVKEFRPDVAVGVGGYASAPMLWAASRRGVPTLIQEQNSFAGLTNRILGRRARKICVAYEGMERFFPADRILITGNPVRSNINRPTAEEREEGYRFFGFDPGKKTLFVVGGSLGSATLNGAMKRWVEEKGAGAPYQVIWQSGRHYKAGIDAFLEGRDLPNLRNYDFIARMDLAFAVADVIVSRAGAGTISELCVAGKATIFVPSPNVTEDHQRHNAMALVRKDAALMVEDSEAVEKLIETAEELLNDTGRIASLEANILTLARKEAGEVIAREVLALVKEQER